MLDYISDKATFERKRFWRKTYSKACHWYFHRAFQIKSTSKTSKRVKISFLIKYIGRRKGQQRHSVNQFNHQLRLSKLRLLFNLSLPRYKSSSSLKLHLWMLATYLKESQLKMWMTPIELRIWFRWLTLKRVSHKLEPKFNPLSTMLSASRLKLERRWMPYLPRRG